MRTNTETRFPTITGETLTGQTLALPGDFEGALNLVLVAFRRDHQPAVDSWIELADRLEGDLPGLRYYELPVISRLYAPAKVFIDGGMRAGITDRRARERTVTVYTDTDLVCRALDIDGTGEIHAFLLDREGNIYWRSMGPRTDEDTDRLRETLDSLS